MTRTDGFRRRLLPALTLLLLLFVASVPAAGPASAHARVVASQPADGSVLATAPTTVTVQFEAKLVTADGDPLRVYGPAGERIDTGATDVSADGTTLSIDLRPGAAEAAGQYHVAYRVISRDAHLLAGRLAFQVAAADPAAATEASTINAVVASTGTADDEVGGLRGAASPWWPKAVAGAAVGALLLRLARQRRRSAGATA